MAQSWWTSTQYKYWFFTKNRLAEIRDELEEQNAKAIEQNPLFDRRIMFIFMKERLHQLAKRLQFRQQSVATALVYIHRYLLSTPVQGVNIYLLVATAFYLSSKTEESPHHIRLVASEARQAWPEFISGDMSRIGEMEFSLISEMRSQLIIWQPYRTLIQLKEEPDLRLTNEEIGFAWSIINDSYMTDLPLTCPPHVIALMAAFLAVIFQPSKPGPGTPTASQAYQLGGDYMGRSSMGGRPGMGSALNQAISQVRSLPGSQASDGSNGQSNSTGASKLGPTATAVASEKVQHWIRFLGDGDLEVEQMIEAVQEIISLYEVWDQYSEKAIKEAVARCLKGRGLDG